MMTEIEASLRSGGKQYPTIPDCAAALGMPYMTLFQRLQVLPPEEKPEAHGAFRAGGALVFNTDAAVAWCTRHEKYWADRQAARTAKK